jgi:hypothetical protein
VGVRDEELFSSRAERSPKTLSPLSRTGSQKTGFQRLTVLARGARRNTRDGEDCEAALSFGGSGGCVLCSQRGASSIVQSCVTKRKGRHEAHSANRGARVVARRGEGSGGGGARVREPSSHTLLSQGGELTLYIGPTPSKLARWD